MTDAIQRFRICRYPGFTESKACDEMGHDVKLIATFFRQCNHRELNELRYTVIKILTDAVCQYLRIPSFYTVLVQSCNKNDWTFVLNFIAKQKFDQVYDSLHVDVLRQLSTTDFILNCDKEFRKKWKNYECFIRSSNYTELYHNKLLCLLDLEDSYGFLSGNEKYHAYWIADLRRRISKCRTRDVPTKAANIRAASIDIVLNLLVKDVEVKLAKHSEERDLLKGFITRLRINQKSTAVKFQNHNPYQLKDYFARIDAFLKYHDQLHRKLQTVLSQETIIRDLSFIVYNYAKVRISSTLLELLHLEVMYCEFSGSLYSRPIPKT